MDVVVAIDASASMWVQDLGPSRLDLAVREVLNLYTQDILTDGDRVALFVFGTTALRQVHMSSNAERFIEQVGQVSPPATLSGDAFPWDSDVAAAFEHIYQSLDNQDRFESGDEEWQPEERSDRLVLLLTDGDFAADAEQLGRLDQALSEFRRRGLTVYPVAIGSRTGVELDLVLQDYVRGARTTTRRWRPTSRASAPSSTPTGSACWRPASAAPRSSSTAPASPPTASSRTSSTRTAASPSS